MALAKTEAIILRSMKLGESSKLLTLYGKKAGLLKLVAKGARQSKSRVRGNLEPLYIIEAVYYEKENRELQTLSQASMIYAPKFMLTDADKTVLAFACAEMVMRSATPGHVNLPVYGLLRAVIEALDQPDTNARLIFFAFQWRLLQCLGFSPALQQCYECASTTLAGGKFDFVNARLYCAACADRMYHGAALAESTIKTLREFTRLPIAKVGALDIPAAVQADIYRFLKTFYQYHLEEMGLLKSIEVLKKMKLMADRVLEKSQSEKNES